MNVQVAFIVYLLMDLLIYPVIAVKVYTKFIPNSTEPSVSNNSIDYCEGETASWNIYCIGYVDGNNPGISETKLVVKKPPYKIELGLTRYHTGSNAVSITEYPKRGCILKGTYRTEDPPNSPPLIAGETAVPHYIDYEFTGCTEEDAGEYDCELRVQNSWDFDPSSNGVTVTFNRNCKSDSATDPPETGNSATDPTGNNASKPTGYPVITLVGIVTITMIN